MNKQCFAIWLVLTILALAYSADNFLDRLRNTEHVSTTERSYTAHAQTASFGGVTEKAKYEHRKDVIKLQRSQPDVMHLVVFSIQQRNIDRLEDILLDVSDPQSLNYGKHLSYEEVQELTANPEGTQRVLNFLETARNKHKVDYKVTKQSLNGEFITVEAPLQLWERLFEAEFHEFSCVEVPDVRFHRALQYTIPSELKVHISSVFNTVQIPDLNSATLKRIRASKRRPLSSTFYTSTNSDTDSATTTTTTTTTILTTNTSLDINTNTASPLATGELRRYVTPALLNRIYKIDSNNGHQLGSQAVYETIGQTFSPTDLTLFQKQFSLPLEAVTTVIGGHMNNHACAADHGNNCIEANLDVQYLMAVANNVPTTYYYWAGDDFLLAWIQQVADMTSPPLVFSISYGVDETELPASYGRDFDVMAMKLGVRGVTILASSGDDGAVSPSASTDSMRCGYNPSFPATSPYVTAVGGTMGPENNTPEVVCQSDKGGIITSGGGFSTIYSTPNWQRPQIQSYLDTIGSGSSGTGGLPGKGAPLAGFNIGGRGYPDVSALAFNYVVAVNNNFTAVSGTSASSPVLAGMVALVNAARIAEGKSPLGWINPVLYQLYEAFAIDITEGTNNCASTGHVCCGQGYSALQGWDPVTGLGSVNFRAFKQALLALGDHPLVPTVAPTAIPGSPTVTPTIAVTAAPSGAPTPYPSINKGWMYLTEYSNTDCEGDITMISGVPVGVCLIQYNANNKAVGSMQYNCNAVQATVSSYRSLTCQESKLDQRQYFGTGCALSVQDTYYLDPSSAYSTSLQCSTRNIVNGVESLVPPVPVTDIVRDYVMQSTYDSQTTCNPSLLSGYSIYLQNHCFDVQDPDYGDYSYKFVYPHVYMYSSIGCASHKPQSELLSDTCSAIEAGRRLSSVRDYNEGASVLDTTDSIQSDGYKLSADDDQMNDAFFEIWSNVQSTVSSTTSPTTLPTANPTAPSIAPTIVPSVDPSIQPTYVPTIKDSPTVIPTIQPTLAPTVISTSSPSVISTNAPTIITTVAPSAAAVVGPVVDELVTISVDQALQGVDAASFKSGGFHAEYVFQVAVSMSIDNTHPSDVAITGLSDDIIIVDNSAASSNMIHTSAQYVSVCVVSYTIKISTSSAGFADSDTAYTTIVSALTTSIQTKLFDKYLNDGAKSFQVPALYNVVTPNSPIVISTTYSSTPTNTDNTNNSGINSSVLIAINVIVVCFVVVLLICLCGKYRAVVCSLCYRSDARYNTLDTESLHGSVHSSISNNSIGSSNSSSANAAKKMTASSLLGRTLMRATSRSNPSAPPAPRFTIETEDEESGNVDPRDGERGIELTATAKSAASTYNPISNSSQTK